MVVARLVWGKMGAGFVANALVTWLIGSLVILGVSALSVVGMLVARRHIHDAVREGHNDVAGFFFATVGVVYAVILAFQVFAVWERYSAAEDDVSNEASAEINLLRATRGLPDGLRQQVQGQLKQYAEDVVNEEWSQMQVGLSSLKARNEQNNVSRLLESWQPQTSADSARYNELLVDMDQWASQRTLRFNDVAKSLPGILWVLLIGGGTLTVGFSFLFHMENVAVQGIMTAITAALIAGTLFFIVNLDRPFSGPQHVPPEPFVHMLDHFNDFVS